MYFAVEDLEAVSRKVNEANGEVLTEIETMPCREQLLYAVDPLGSRNCFARSDTLFTGSIQGKSVFVNGSPASTVTDRIRILEPLCAIAGRSNQSPGSAPAVQQLLGFFSAYSIRSSTTF